MFHDAALQRLTDAEGPVAAFSLAELAEVSLRGSIERIPMLVDLLSLIGGQVALICEIKSSFDGDTELAARAAEIAKTYQGPLAFKSFDPDVVAFLRDAGCPRPLGIVAEASYDDPYFAAMSSAQKRDCATLLHIGSTRPDFLSWAVADLPHATPCLFRALANKPVMAWTVRRPDQWALVRAYADQAVFEGAA